MMTLARRYPWLPRAITVSLSLLIFVVIGAHLRDRWAGHNPPLAQDIFTGCKWAAITSTVVAGPVVGGVGQTALERVLGTIVGGTLGFLVYSLDVYLSADTSDLIDCLLFGFSSAVVGFSSEWLGHRMQLTYSSKLMTLTFLLVFAGAKDVHNAHMIMLSRMCGILAGVTLTIIFAITILPVSANDKLQQSMVQALEALRTLDRCMWLPVQALSDGSSPSERVAELLLLLEKSGVALDGSLSTAEEAMVQVYTTLDEVEDTIPTACREVLFMRLRGHHLYMPRFLAYAVGRGHEKRLPKAQILELANKARAVAQLQLSLCHLFRSGLDDILKDVMRDRYPDVLMPHLMCNTSRVLKDCADAFPHGTLIGTTSWLELEQAVKALIDISGIQRARIARHQMHYKEQAVALRSRVDAMAVTPGSRRTSGRSAQSGGSPPHRPPAPPRSSRDLGSRRNISLTSWASMTQRFASLRRGSRDPPSDSLDPLLPQTMPSDGQDAFEASQHSVDRFREVLESHATNVATGQSPLDAAVSLSVSMPDYHHTDSFSFRGPADAAGGEAASAPAGPRPDGAAGAAVPVPLRLRPPTTAAPSTVATSLYTDASLGSSALATPNGTPVDTSAWPGGLQEELMASESTSAWVRSGVMDWSNLSPDSSDANLAPPKLDLSASAAAQSMDRRPETAATSSAGVDAGTAAALAVQPPPAPAAPARRPLHGIASFAIVEEEEEELEPGASSIASNGLAAADSEPRRAQNNPGAPASAKDASSSSADVGANPRPSTSDSSPPDGTAQSLAGFRPLTHNSDEQRATAPTDSEEPPSSLPPPTQLPKGALSNNVRVVAGREDEAAGSPIPVVGSPGSAFSTGPRESHGFPLPRIDTQRLVLFPNSPEGHYAEIKYYTFQFHMEELCAALLHLQHALQELLIHMPENQMCSKRDYSY